MVVLFLSTLLVGATQMPLLMVVLRSVREEEKAFALGLQFFIFRLFGYIPRLLHLFEHCFIFVVVYSPIIFGNLVDSTCLLWKETCSGADGRCLLYDLDMFRLKYVGIGAAIKVWLIEKRLILVVVFKGCGSLFLCFDLVADGREEEGAGQADHQRDNHLHHLPRQDRP